MKWTYIIIIIVIIIIALCFILTKVLEDLDVSVKDLDIFWMSYVSSIYVLCPSILSMYSHDRKIIFLWKRLLDVG